MNCEILLDSKGNPLAVGNRVIVSPSPLGSSDASRYRSQSYGLGTVVQADYQGVYVQVDGATDRTWVCSQITFTDFSGQGRHHFTVRNVIRI